LVGSIKSFKIKPINHLIITGAASSADPLASPTRLVGDSRLRWVAGALPMGMAGLRKAAVAPAAGTADAAPATGKQGARRRTSSPSWKHCSPMGQSRSFAITGWT
jgi:hypothetical protein